MKLDKLLMEAGEVIDREQFRKEMEEFWSWTSSQPRMRTSWWVSVVEFAKMKFNETYDKDFGSVKEADLGNWGQYGTITDDAPYGQHIQLSCKNHPDLRWSTKNIAPIGARSIFFQSDGRECDCSAKDLYYVGNKK